MFIINIIVIIAFVIIVEIIDFIIIELIIINLKTLMAVHQLIERLENDLNSYHQID